MKILICLLMLSSIGYLCKIHQIIQMSQKEKKHTSSGFILMDVFTYSVWQAWV